MCMRLDARHWRGRVQLKSSCYDLFPSNLILVLRDGFELSTPKPGLTTPDHAAYTLSAPAGSALVRYPRMVLTLTWFLRTAICGPSVLFPFTIHTLRLAPVLGGVRVFRMASILQAYNHFDIVACHHNTIANFTKIVKCGGNVLRIPIRCFQFNPSVKSSLTFLRKTPWARTKVEAWFIEEGLNSEANPTSSRCPPSEDSPICLT